MFARVQSTYAPPRNLSTVRCAASYGRAVDRTRPAAKNLPNKRANPACGHPKMPAAIFSLTNTYHGCPLPRTVGHLTALIPCRQGGPTTKMLKSMSRSCNRGIGKRSRTMLPRPDRLWCPKQKNHETNPIQTQSNPIRREQGTPVPDRHLCVSTTRYATLFQVMTETMNRRNFLQLTALSTAHPRPYR